MIKNISSKKLYFTRADKWENATFQLEVQQGEIKKVCLKKSSKKKK